MAGQTSSERSRIEEPALSSYKYLQGPQPGLGGRADTHGNKTHTSKLGLQGRTHLGRRLSEQRSVVQAAGAIGPGRKVLHFRVSSLSQATQS